MKKKAQVLKGMFIAFLVAGLIVIVSGMIISESAREYDVPISPKYQQSFSKFENMTSSVNNLTYGMKSKMDDNDIAPEGLAMLGSMTRGAFTAIKMIWIIPEATYSLLSDISNELGLPTIILAVAIGVIIIIILFALIQSFLPAI